MTCPTGGVLQICACVHLYVCVCLCVIESVHACMFLTVWRDEIHQQLGRPPMLPCPVAHKSKSHFPCCACNFQALST